MQVGSNAKKIRTNTDTSSMNNIASSNTGATATLSAKVVVAAAAAAAVMAAAVEITILLEAVTCIHSRIVS